jgi:hypothetical protein
MSRRKPNKGERYVWGDNPDTRVTMTVLRVAKNKSWADIRCEQPNGATWVKRQPTPIPGMKLS